MAQPPDPGRDTGPEPARDPGLPGGGSGAASSGAGASGGDGRSAGVGSWVADAGRAERLAVFASGRAGDRFPPNSWLAMLVDELSGPDRRCPGASDDALIGLLGRWQALESWASAGKLGVVAERARRRARPGHAGRRPAGLPTAWGECTGHEVSAALGMSLPGADDLLALAVGLQARLPRIYGLLAAGVIDYIKAKIIDAELAVLDDALAAEAEALIIDQLAGKTPGQVRRLAAAAVVAVDPRGAEKRREAAERETARVRFWREAAGTAALAAYGLPADAALAANANIAARARLYKQAKLMGSMDQLRVLAYLDMLNGVAAQDRIARARAEEQAARARAGARGEAGGGAGDTMPGGPVPGGDDAPAGSGAGAAGNGTSGGRGPADDQPGGGRPGDDDPWGDGDRWDWGPPEDGPGYQWLGNDGPWDDDDYDDDLDADGTGDDQPPDSDAGDDLPDDDRDAGDDSGARDDSEGGDEGGPGRDDRPAGPGGGPGAGAAPRGDDPGPELAASINLTLPLETVQRLAGRPGHGHGLGPLDPALVRDLATAAARSPHSTWCLTITSPQGYAIGHGCARPARHKHGNAPPPGGRAGPWTLTRNDDDPVPPGGYGTWTLALPGGRDYTIRLWPIPLTSCDHRHESSGYQPAATLRHLVQVRDGTCTFPPCSRHARESDFEHAVPYDQGGRTCACNAGARSRRCHRVKQSPGWTVTQPLPGWHQWKTPSGRSYTQEPMKYPA